MGVTIITDSKPDAGRLASLLPRLRCVLKRGPLSNRKGLIQKALMNKPISLSRLCTETSQSLVLAAPIPVFEDFEMSMTDLCDAISRKPSLARIKVVAAECYVMKNVVHHRYVVFELLHPEGWNLWLRLDRRRGINNLALFLLSASISPANDTARLSRDKDRLIEPTTQRENRLLFEDPFALTLEDLRQYLGVLTSELTEYRMYKENCWFFVSVIQEMLKSSNRGALTEGKMKHLHWALKVRSRLTQRVEQLYRMNHQPFTVSQMLRHLSTKRNDYDTIPHLRTLMSFSLQLDSVPNAQSDEAIAIIRRLATTIHTFSPTFDPSSWGNNSWKGGGALFNFLLWGMSTGLLRQLLRAPSLEVESEETMEHQKQLSEALIYQARALVERDHGVNHYAEASKLAEESFALAQRYHHDHPDQYHADVHGNLAYFDHFQHYADISSIFQQAGRWHDASDVIKEAALRLRRHHATHPHIFFEPLTTCLRKQYSLLSRLHSYQEACDTAVSHMAVRRSNLIYGDEVEKYYEVFQSLVSGLKQVGTVEQLHQAYEDEISFYRSLPSSSWRADELMLALMRVACEYACLLARSPSDADRLRMLCIDVEQRTETITKSNKLNSPWWRRIGYLTDLLITVGRKEDACAVYKERVVIAKSLFDADPSGYSLPCTEDNIVVKQLELHTKYLREAGMDSEADATLGEIAHYVIRIHKERSIRRYTNPSVGRTPEQIRHQAEIDEMYRKALDPNPEPSTIIQSSDPLGKTVDKIFPLETMNFTFMPFIPGYISCDAESWNTWRTPSGFNDV